LGPIPNPQSPIPNPHYNLKKFFGWLNYNKNIFLMFLNF